MPAPSKRVDMSEPAATLRAAFAALEAADMNTYIDLLDPDIRSTPNNPGLLGQLLGTLTGVRVDTASLAFRDMQYSVVQQSESWAWVQVQGFVRSLALGTENPMNEIMLTRKLDGRWYVSSETAFRRSPESAATQTALAQATQVAQVATATAAARATETAFALANELVLEQAKQRIAAKDWYWAAAELQSVILADSTNKQALELLASIQPNVPGALAFDNGYYYDFTADPIKPIPNIPQGTRLERLARNGLRGVVVAPNNTRYLVDLSTGSKVAEAGRGCWSPNLTRLAYRTGDGLPTYNLVIALADQPENPIKEVTLPAMVEIFDWCWMDEEIVLVEIERIDPDPNYPERYFTLVDANTGETRDVKLPGFTDEMRVYLSRDRDSIYLVAKDKLLQSDLDGKKIETLMTIPDGELAELMGSRGSTDFISDAPAVVVRQRGLIVNFLTGTVFGMPFEAFAQNRGVANMYAPIGWVDRLPDVPVATPQPATVSVNPTQGPRGTVFEFTLTGGLMGQAIAWQIINSAGNVLADGADNLRDNGTSNQFHFTSDLTTDSGALRIIVTSYDDRTKVLAESSFTVQ